MYMYLVRQSNTKKKPLDLHKSYVLKVEKKDPKVAYGRHKTYYITYKRFIFRVLKQLKKASTEKRQSYGS